MSSGWRQSRGRKRSRKGGAADDRSRNYSSSGAFAILFPCKIPAEEIAFIHDAKTDAQREALFKDMRSGKKKILIGSTDQCGTGVNVQAHITAMHHVDCPWKPSCVGRILRTFKIKKNVEVTDNGKIII